MNYNIPNLIIIWGNDDYNTLGLHRQLANHGLRLFFLICGGKKNIASKSKYCVSFHIANSIDDGLVYLYNNFKEETFKPIIINSYDLIAEAIDKNYDKLSKRYIVSGCSKSGLLTRISDKVEMSNLASNVGFDTPLSKPFKWGDSIEDIKYPCVIKPTKYTPGRVKEFKLKICKCKDDLEKTIKLIRHDTNFIVQQYIPKDKDILIYGCRTFNGEIYLAGTFYKDRWSDGGDGSHGYIVPDIPDCVKPKSINSFLSEIDYHGLFSFEYGLYDGKAYFYEINLRNDGTSHYFFQGGANLPLLWVLSCSHLEHPQNIEKVKGSHEFIDDVFDFVNIFHGNVSLKKWKSQKKQADIFMYFDKDDIEPYKVLKSRRIISILSNWIKSKFRLRIVYILDKIHNIR